MESTAIRPKAVTVALEYCTTDAFERFGQQFLSASLGAAFVPAGGMHDGGVDGFFEPVHESKGQIDSFFQISKQQDVHRKIRETHRRLIAAARQPFSLTLLTSRPVSDIDLLEEKLSNELRCRIKIRDCGWIESNINSSPQAQLAFHTELAPAIAFLSQLGSARIGARLGDGAARTAYVFLAQEVERRRGQTQLLEAVVDSLILWALEGTDPDSGNFMSRGEISRKILEAFPASRQFLSAVLNHRLEALSSKTHASERQVRWHRKPDTFCLPFETRKLVSEENIEDEALRAAVTYAFEDRAAKTGQLKNTTPNQIADLAHRTVERVFEAQGLDTATFLSSANPPSQTPTVAEHVEAEIGSRGLKYEAATEAKEVVLEVLRGAFYASRPEERAYFSKLSRTYTLFLALKTEPRIVEYFRSMTTRLTLYVGSDILVLALSEYFLAEEDQMVTTMLRVVQAAGARLVLCEPVLTEVLGQFRASDGEFKAVFHGTEQYVTRDLARHAERILVRSYFYARLSKPPGRKVPTTWQGFVDSFLTYENLQKPHASTDLRRYLCERFGMSFESHDDMMTGVSDRKLTELAARLESIKEGDRYAERARNDALMALSVYARRNTSGELGGGNPFGFTTWWLTKESRIRAATAELVRSQGARFIMVPEFLLNFIALAPSAAEVRAAFESVFPSRLGIRLSNRMREDVFKDAMQKAREASELDPARLQAKLAELSDELKGDRFKHYERRVGSSFIDRQ
jgi:hypothetical protein